MTVTVSGSTATATSPGYTTTGVGTEYWVATFSGDTNNAAVTSGAAAETVNVDTISTSQTPAMAYVGESISDTATVTGLVSPSSSDTVTFKLYNNSTASGTPLYTSSPVTVSDQRQHGHGHVARLHHHRRGHGILGGEFQRRHEQRRRQQRRRGGDGERGHDQHQPDAGHGLRGRVDQRHGDGDRPGQPQQQRYGDVQAVQQQHASGTPLYTSPP